MRLLPTSTSALRAAQHDAQRAARQIQRASTKGAKTERLSRGIIELTRAQRHHGAALSVVRTADEMVGSLLDIVA